MGEDVVGVSNRPGSCQIEQRSRIDLRAESEGVQQIGSVGYRVQSAESHTSERTSALDGPSGSMPPSTMSFRQSVTCAMVARKCRRPTRAHQFPLGLVRRDDQAALGGAWLWKARLRSGLTAVVVPTEVFSSTDRRVNQGAVTRSG
jgi:hypothetical protein